MDKEFIKKAIDDAVNSGVVSGISAAFIEKDGNEYYIKGKMGSIDGYEKRELTLDALYDMASCTKVICTTTMIFRLIEDGKLSLDDRVSDYLERFRYQEVTVADLLLHRSGLPSDMEDKASLTKDNIIDRIYATDLVSEPRTITAYSDIGFILLGFIIEKIVKRDLASLYEEEILRPLGMVHSSYHPYDKSLCVPTEKTKERGLIVGEAHDRKGYLLGDDCASAGLFSNIVDVAKFVRAYLYREDAILSEKTVELMRKTDIGNRSYGWDKKYHGDTLYHTGFTGTSILMRFDKMEGVVLLSNRIHPSRSDHGFLDWRNDLNEEILKG